MTGFQEFRKWSVLDDREIVRLSMFDQNGGEHYCIVEPLEGRSWRERRERCVEHLAEHIGAGNPPGEVAIEVEAQWRS